jgi:1-acyl-sn-glycerol-3-phosphate acyltransferase
MTLVIPKSRFGTPQRWYHRLGWVLFRALRHACPLRMEGAELLPRAGPAVVIAPHMSYSDSVAILYPVLPRPPRFVSAAFYVLTSAPLSWITFLAGVIPLDKQAPDIQAARRILRLLAAGEVVALFPEGERAWAGVPIDPLMPSAKFLARLKVPIYVAEIEGSYDHWPRWDDIPRWRPVTVRLRGPIALPRVAGSSHGAHGAINWWNPVYQRGGRLDANAARDALASVLYEACRGEASRLDLFRRGRFRQVSRLICFCPECTSPKVVADAQRLACPGCGAAWMPAPAGTLRREGALEVESSQLLSEVFLRMLEKLRTGVAGVIPLEEAVGVSVLASASGAAAHGRARLDRDGLTVTTAGGTWNVDLASAVGGQLEGSRVFEVHARDGTELSLHSDGGALRLALAACALSGLPWGRYLSNPSIATGARRATRA